MGYVIALGGLLQLIVCGAIFALGWWAARLGNDDPAGLIGLLVILALLVCLVSDRVLVCGLAGSICK